MFSNNNNNCKNNNRRVKKTTRCKPHHHLPSSPTKTPTLPWVSTSPTSKSSYQKQLTTTSVSSCSSCCTRKPTAQTAVVDPRGQQLRRDGNGPLSHHAFAGREFDFHRDNRISDVCSMVNIEYVIPANEQGGCPLRFLLAQSPQRVGLLPHHGRGPPRHRRRRAVHPDIHPPARGAC